MNDPDWAAQNIDTNQPSAARMYDYYLGGSHNFASDRQAAGKVLELLPDAPLMAQANRAFLHRSVRFLVDQGVRQFIDLGSGIPTAGNVHEVAPESTVVYVDIDPVAVAYSEAILSDVSRAAIVHADARQPEKVLESPVTQGLLDFDQPIGLLMVAVLHFVAESEDPANMVATFRDALPAGSAIALAHVTLDERPEEMERITAIYQNSANPTTFRTRQQIDGLLTGWDLVDPGVTWVVEWRPDWPDDADGNSAWCGNYGAVGWKQ
ncbi:SAM-dependent methyltransferase [Cryptosporangium sp. NPDC048952]|uniref:SAM-dependent methyltransferase n=1 Tax=Cryptosporangium sp. NPDC048952 TaxID=3363961 RepID=UPI0037169A5F